MKKITKNRVIHKITIILALIVSLNFIAPKYSFASVEDIAGGLLKEVVQLFAAIGDVVMGGLNHFMLGTAGVSSAMLDQNDINLSDPNSWLVSNLDDADAPTVDLDEEKFTMDEKTFLLDADEFKIPNMLYSPENIFANNIAVLDINFLNPNQYQSVVVEGKNEQQAEKMAQSAAGGELQEVIASWYKAFRNIAIVGLLSVLVYLGIRILISSTATDKAKYKESLKDWAVALCLVFVIHFIMSGILMATNAFNNLFGASIDEGIIVEGTKSNGEELKFRTNLIGLARFKAQGDQWQDATVYTIIYLALVIYTVIFTVIYFKRFLWMAFFTMIAPLVALTYPIDRAGDGHAQAFNLWFKEYTMNAILQPVHLILYTVFVSSAIDLATDNPIYAIVAIAFLLPAEKFIKKMFGFDKAETAGGFGSFAGGALTMKGLNMLSHLGKGKSSSSGKSGGSDGGDNGNARKINFAKTDDAGKLSEFGSGKDNGNRGGANNPRLDDGNPNERDEVPENNESSEDNGRVPRGIDSFPNNDSENPYLENEEDKGDFLAEDEHIPTWAEMNDLKEKRDLYSSIANNEDNSPISRAENQKKLDEINERIERGKELRRGRAVETAKGLGRFALKGAKPLGKGLKFAGKGLLRATGAIGGATVGLAAGLTTGDMSNAVSMAAAGAVAGNMIGKTAGTIPGRAINFGKNQANNIRNIPNNLEDAWNDSMYGPAVARQKRIQRQNEQAREALLKNKDERNKAKELAGKMGYNGSIDNILNAKADLYEQGITDDDLINNTIQTEYKQEKELNGNRHNQYVGAAGFINKNNYSKADIDDVKKMGALEERVQAKLPSDQEAQNDVMKITTGILGADDVYSMRQQAGQTRIKSVTSKKPAKPTQPTQPEQPAEPTQPTKPRTQEANT